MNLKALITTLVLGSSSMASADSVSFSGSVHVSLGGTTRPTPVPAPVIIRDHRTIAADPCATAAPTYVPSRYELQHVTYQQPVWGGEYLLNARMSGTDTIYTGWMATNQSQWRGGYRVISNQSWFDLTDATRIVGNGHREVFNVGAGRGQFRALKLQALGTGNSNINNVKIEFADGSKQDVLVKQRLDAGNPSINIDLAGNYRTINRIYVYGLSHEGAAYKILAM